MSNEFVMVPRELAEEINAALTLSGYVSLPRGLQVAMAKPAEQNQGEPVAWQDPDNDSRMCTAEHKAYALSKGGAPAAALSTLTRPLYTQPDPGEVERLRAEVDKLQLKVGQSFWDKQDRDDTINDLRAQLAEAHSLLHRALPYLSNTPDLVQHGAEDLAEEIRSASAGRPCYGPNEWGTECGKCSKCKHASAEKIEPVAPDQPNQ